MLGSKTTNYSVFITNDFYTVRGSRNLEYTVGDNVTLACITSPTPPAGSVFRWRCHDGCSFNMKIGQTINFEVELTDSGEINCSVIVNEVEHASKTVELRVLGKYRPYFFCAVYMHY